MVFLITITQIDSNGTLFPLQEIQLETTDSMTTERPDGDDVYTSIKQARQLAGMSVTNLYLTSELMISRSSLYKLCVDGERDSFVHVVAYDENETLSADMKAKVIPSDGDVKEDS